MLKISLKLVVAPHAGQHSGFVEWHNLISLGTQNHPLCVCVCVCVCTKYACHVQAVSVLCGYVVDVVNWLYRRTLA